jgi:hypothetical protein
MMVADSLDLQQLEERIQSFLGSRVLHLALERHGDGVILHGTAHTYHAKQLAQHALMTAGGVSIIVNHIEVLR